MPVVSFEVQDCDFRRSERAAAGDRERDAAEQGEYRQRDWSFDQRDIGAGRFDGGWADFRIRAEVQTEPADASAQGKAQTAAGIFKWKREVG
jgi:hypothetical protein